jgi:hypothetical protein
MPIQFLHHPLLSRIFLPFLRCHPHCIFSNETFIAPPWPGPSRDNVAEAMIFKPGIDNGAPFVFRGTVAVQFQLAF